MVDPMSIGYDKTFLSLTKNLRKLYRGENVASKAISKGLARANRGELIRITNKNNTLSFGDSLEKAIFEMLV